MENGTHKESYPQNIMANADAGMAAEGVSYAPTKPQADIAALTNDYIATEKERPNVQIAKMLHDQKLALKKATDALVACKAQQAVEVKLEKESHNEWRLQQEREITELRSAMTKRDQEHDKVVKTINERAEHDVKGHNEIIARCKSFIAGEVLS